MRSSKVPIRMCIGCSKHCNKSELIKITKGDNSLEIDRKFNKPGRGAYLCKDLSCLNRLCKSRRLERLFNMSIDCTIYQEIGDFINNE